MNWLIKLLTEVFLTPVDCTWVQMPDEDEDEALK